MRRPTHRARDQDHSDKYNYEEDGRNAARRQSPFGHQQQQQLLYAQPFGPRMDTLDHDYEQFRHRSLYSTDVQRAIDGIRFIADHIRETDAFGNVR